jgi:hypothetical protein
MLSSIAVAQTQVPNDFQAGTPARAADVNANFDALENAINGHASDIADNAANIATNAAGIAANTAALSNPTAVRWLANGQVVGTFLHNNALLTFEDYEVRWEYSSGQISTVGDGYLFYLDTDCQGQAYARETILIGNFIGNGGAVVSSPFSGDPIRLYYWDADSTLIVNQTFLSTLSEANGGCSNSDNVGVDAYPVDPNDPAVTGVSSEFFDLPMRIAHR